MRVNDLGLSIKPQSVGHLDLQFDYATLPPSVEKFLRGQADRIRRQCASSIIQIGKALLESKRHLTHGAFLRWVECEVGIHPRTAQSYMRAAQWASGKGAIVAHLPPSALYVLSGNGIPEDFVENVVKRMEAGERIPASAIRHELKALRLDKDCASSEISTTPDILDNCVQTLLPVETGDNEGRAAIAELANLLMQKLSSVDFVRVCEILTCNSVLTDPQLTETLKDQFALQRVPAKYLKPAKCNPPTPDNETGEPRLSASMVAMSETNTDVVDMMTLTE